VPADIQYDPQGLQALNAALAFIVFSVALHLRLDQLRAVLASPRVVIVGLAAQWLALPAITLALIVLVQPAPVFAAGMVLIAACPGGQVSNFYAMLAHGNAVLSVTLTSISTIACALLTPVLFAIGMRLVGDGNGALDVPFPDMLRLLVWTVLLPLAAGLAMQRWLPAWTRWLRTPSRRLAGLLLAAIIAVGLFNNRALIVDPTVVAMYGLVVVHNALAFAGGYGVARLARAPEAEARAITLETGIQNAGLGLILIFNFYPDLGGMMTLVALWGVWHLVAGAILARWWHRRGVAAPAPRG